MALKGCEDVSHTTHQAMLKSPIGHNVTLSGTGSWLANTTIESEQPILRGRLGFLKGHSGLMVHATDTEQLGDLEMEFRALPGLTISIMLEGRLEIGIGRQNFTLCDRPQTSGRLWMLTKPTKLMRRADKGQRIRKVHITVSQDWLNTLFRETGDYSNDFREFTQQHAATAYWQPSKKILGLADQILNPPKQSPMMEKLYLEARAIEIISEACAQFSPMPDDAVPVLSATQQTRARKITDYIDDHLMEEIPLQKIAQDLGMSVASLQRVFKAAYDRTVNDMIRERRLTAAREAMEKDGLSIGQAAYLAGYNDPANFSKAFKRQFGISPSLIRQ